LKGLKNRNGIRFKHTAEALENARGLVTFLVHGRGPKGFGAQLIRKLIDWNGGLDAPFVELLMKAAGLA
jgi:hypothetical protein